MDKKDVKHQENFENSKQEQLNDYRVNNDDKYMTTNQGLRVAEDEQSLTAGERGPTLLEDFYLREKITHFDHERIPERVVHARGSGAHGVFEVYESQSHITKAKFLQDPAVKTPVFVRFSTVAGSRGSGDTVRDVRGFATKFYTEEGNYDLVGNNMPVFFIQDAIKFPDLIHAVKPEPHNEIPQASTAHDTFWDFIANNPESAHMMMWAVSDRAIPRSYRMMEGFGVHTFRLVNAEGKAHFVKFHWKPTLGIHSLVWEEAQKIAGDNPDFHRQDLWEAIEMGNGPSYELGVQLIPEEDEFKFNFDVLDPTKLWPEEIVPVQIIGKMTLNRNQDNAFAETEQVAFHPGNVVPGIDFTNDPLLQGRLFSYTDTQLTRLGGPNFHELPINRPVCPFHNNQQDGMHRMTIHTGQTAYHRNSLRNNNPRPASEEEGGYVHYQEKVEGRKIRKRSESFKDYFSQAKMFWNSMTEVEKQHMVQAFHFELGKVKSKDVKKQVIELISHVDAHLAEKVASGLGLDVPQGISASEETFASKALSQMHTKKNPNTRKVAVLVENGYQHEELEPVMQQLENSGISASIVSKQLGAVKSVDGQSLDVTDTLLTSDAVLFDAVIIAGGKDSVDRLVGNRDAILFLNAAFTHYKAIGVLTEGEALLDRATFLHAQGAKEQPGIVSIKQDIAAFNEQFIQAVAEHRHWSREV